MRTAGHYPHRLTVQAPVQTQDHATGDITNDWQTIATIWARIEPIRGREALIDEKILAEMNTRIMVRWSPLAEKLTSAHRGLHQDTIFNFVSIAHVLLERREIEIMAKSGINNG